MKLYTQNNKSVFHRRISQGVWQTVFFVLLSCGSFLHTDMFFQYQTIPGQMII